MTVFILKATGNLIVAIAKTASVISADGTELLFTKQLFGIGACWLQWSDMDCLPPKNQTEVRFVGVPVCSVLVYRLHCCSIQIDYQRDEPEI